MYKKIIGTKKAGEDATITYDGQTVIVTWDESKEVVKFENEEAFEAWTTFNRYIKEVI